MGTPLTGSSVASTYTGLLKNTDNSTVSATLKAISDGSGNDSALQISSVAVNATNDFSVNGAASKFTVASASGNTAIAGTLGVTGATSLSSLATSGAATIGGALNVTGATTLTGNLAVPGNLAVTGTSTLTGNTAVTGTLGVAGASTLASVGVTGSATVGTTLGVTGATTLASLGVTGAATVGTTLGVSGASTFQNVTIQGSLSATNNTTLGNNFNDLLTINANVVTFPFLTNVTVDLDNDKVLITDYSDSSKLKSIAASALGINASNSPQCVQQVLDTSVEIVPSNTSFGTEITGLTTTITPRSATSKVLITVTVCYGCLNTFSVYNSFRLSRGVVELGSPASWGTARQHGIASAGYNEGTGSGYPNVRTFSFLDSPGTASAVTYKINIFSTSGASAGSVFINRAYDDSDNSGYSRSISTMTLQEYFA